MTYKEPDKEDTTMFNKVLAETKPSTLNYNKTTTWIQKAMAESMDKKEAIQIKPQMSEDTLKILEGRVGAIKNQKHETLEIHSDYLKHRNKYKQKYIRYQMREEL